MAKVVIVISGGVVQAVESDLPDLELKIIDIDDLSSEGIHHQEIEDFIDKATVNTKSIIGNQA